MDNLLLKAWEEERGHTYTTSSKGILNNRDIAAQMYAWGIPNDAALDEIAKHQPILEIGAGSGYWARLLQDRGVRIRATDPDPPNPLSAWTKVMFGDELDLLHNKKTLFMCWVPQQAAKQTVELYEGDTVLWVGEPIEFAGFEEVKRVEIPQWDGFEDALFVFKRRKNG